MSIYKVDKERDKVNSCDDDRKVFVYSNHRFCRSVMKNASYIQFQWQPRACWPCRVWSSILTFWGSLEELQCRSFLEVTLVQGTEGAPAFHSKTVTCASTCRCTSASAMLAAAVAAQDRFPTESCSTASRTGRSGLAPVHSRGTDAWKEIADAKRQQLRLRC